MFFLTFFATWEKKRDEVIGKTHTRKSAFISIFFSWFTFPKVHIKFILFKLKGRNTDLKVIHRETQYLNI